MKRRAPAWRFVGGRWRPVILEKDVVEEITTRLWLEYKIRVYRVRERLPGMGRMSEPGIPDLIGWLPGGRFLGIECKRESGGVRRAAQERFIAEAQSGGCVALFAGSWDEVAAELARHGVKAMGRAA